MDNKLTVTVDMDMTRLISEMQIAARALRGFTMTLNEAADKLEQTLKTLE